MQLYNVLPTGDLYYTVFLIPKLELTYKNKEQDTYKLIKMKKKTKTKSTGLD